MSTDTLVVVFYIALAIMVFIIILRFFERLFSIGIISPIFRPFDDFTRIIVSLVSKYILIISRVIKIFFLKQIFHMSREAVMAFSGSVKDQQNALLEKLKGNGHGELTKGNPSGNHLKEIAKELTR